MKIKRYLGTDMRDALRLVRAELGPEAVILGTRPLGTGVEVSAAVDAEHLPGSLPAPEPQPVAAANDESLLLSMGGGAHRAGAQVANAQMASEQQAMSEELRALRQLLERQMSALAWNDYTRREPLKARALGELTDLGLGRDVALAVINELPEHLTAEQAQRMHYGLLARRLLTCDSPVAEGGTLALVGAPGSGRTTVLAKLALRWVLEHGANSIALVVIDDEHIGAAEQARSLGRLLGVPSFRYPDAESLAQDAARFRGYHCVLVDAPSLGADAALNGQRARTVAEALPGMATMLVLPASVQAGVLEETVRRAQTWAPDCCVLTRIDEAVSLGGLLSTLVRSGLPAALVSDGPTIPEDLRPARGHQLVVRAAELARQCELHADEDLLAQRFGGSLNDAA
jgi:flagellar biosynthesis protein FlhF